LKNKDHKYQNELKELMFKPMSNEEVERLRKIRAEDRWLLSLNFQEMGEDLSLTKKAHIPIAYPEVRPILFRQLKEQQVKGKVRREVLNETIIDDHLQAAGSRKPFFPSEIQISIPLKKNKHGKRACIEFEKKKREKVWIVGLNNVANEEIEYIRIIITFADGESAILDKKHIQEGCRWELFVNKPPIKIEIIHNIKEL